MIWIEREEVQVIHPIVVCPYCTPSPSASASIDEEVLHDDALLGIHNGHILSREESGRFCFCKVFHTPKVLVVILIDIEVVSIAHPFECLVKCRSRLIDKREVIIIYQTPLGLSTFYNASVLRRDSQQ